jgi:hypothetical protein
MNSKSLQHEVICHVCDLRTRAKFQMCRHVSLHADQKIFKCQICRKNFRFKFRLRQHETVHQKTSAKSERKCHQCPAILRTKIGFIDHIRLHGFGEQFQCKICIKSKPILCLWRTLAFHVFCDKKQANVPQFLCQSIRTFSV